MSKVAKILLLIRKIYSLITLKELWRIFHYKGKENHIRLVKRFGLIFAGHKCLSWGASE